MLLAICLLTCLAAGLPAPAVRAQITLSGPVTLYIGPGGLVTIPSYLTVGSGATLTNEGQVDFGGDLTNNGIVTTPGNARRPAAGHGGGRPAKPERHGRPCPCKTSR